MAGINDRLDFHMLRMANRSVDSATYVYGIINESNQGEKKNWIHTADTVHVFVFKLQTTWETAEESRV